MTLITNHFPPESQFPKIEKEMIQDLFYSWDGYEAQRDIVWDSVCKI